MLTKSGAGATGGGLFLAASTTTTLLLLQLLLLLATIDYDHRPFSSVAEATDVAAGGAGGGDPYGGGDDSGVEKLGGSRARFQKSLSTKEFLFFSFFFLLALYFYSPPTQPTPQKNRQNYLIALLYIILYRCVVYVQLLIEFSFGGRWQLAPWAIDAMGN